MFISELIFSVPEEPEAIHMRLYSTNANGDSNGDYYLTTLAEHGFNVSNMDDFIRDELTKLIVYRTEHNEYSLNDILTHRSQSQPHLEVYIVGDFEDEDGNITDVRQYTNVPLNHAGADFLQTFLLHAQNYRPEKELYLFVKDSLVFAENQIEDNNLACALQFVKMASKLLDHPDAVKLVEQSYDGAAMIAALDMLQWQLEQ